MENREYRVLLDNAWVTYRNGRTHLGRLPEQGDVIATITTLCQMNAVTMASFTINKNSGV
jgi:hypothetical protein